MMASARWAIAPLGKPTRSAEDEAGGGGKKTKKDHAARGSGDVDMPDNQAKPKAKAEAWPSYAPRR